MRYWESILPGERCIPRSIRWSKRHPPGNSCPEVHTNRWNRRRCHPDTHPPQGNRTVETGPCRSHQGGSTLLCPRWMNMSPMRMEPPCPGRRCPVMTYTLLRSKPVCNPGWWYSTRPSGRKGCWVRAYRRGQGPRPLNTTGPLEKFRTVRCIHRLFSSRMTRWAGNRLAESLGYRTPLRNWCFHPATILRLSCTVWVSRRHNLCFRNSIRPSVLYCMRSRHKWSALH